MNKLELKNKIGEYVKTGLKLIAVGNKYVYFYSIWDNGKGSHSGYCRQNLHDNFVGLEYISKSQVRAK